MGAKPDAGGLIDAASAPGLLDANASAALDQQGCRPMEDQVPTQAQAEWEEDLAKRVEEDTRIPITEKRQVILARRGQGKFRERVSRIEHVCRITGVNRPEHLIASHCKPWRDCESNDERLDGENGLLLTPTVDHLFDHGFISFENNGDVLMSPVVHRESLKRMGIGPEERRNVGAFSDGQRRYLEFLRDLVFLEARVRRQ
jgi:hypothetical protein